MTWRTFRLRPRGWLLAVSFRRAQSSTSAIDAGWWTFGPAIHGLVAANGTDGLQRRAVTTLNEAARRVRLGVRLHPEDGYRLMAEGVGIDRPIGELLIAVTGSMAAGSWDRLKVCANEACQSAFYDSSRNRSGRWCSMARCGNRMKGRAYRERRSGATFDERVDDRAAVAG